MSTHESGCGGRHAHGEVKTDTNTTTPAGAESVSAPRPDSGIPPQGGTSGPVKPGQEAKKTQHRGCCG